MPSLRSPQRGQASIDYVALIAALTLLLAGATAAITSGDAAGVVNAVHGQMRRALCIVTGGACPAEERKPCVVARTRTNVHVSVSILLLRVDDDHYVLREKLSDGSVRLTFAEGSGVGVEGGIGGRLKIALRGRTIGTEREVHGAVQGVLERGMVFVATDDDEADDIVHDLLKLRLPFISGGPKPREIFFEGGVRGLGRLGISSGMAGASLDALADATVAARRDQRTGEVTISLKAGASGWGLLTELIGPSASADQDIGLALTLDRDGHPTELSLSATGAIAAGGTFAPVLNAPLELGGGQITQADMRGRRWELGARIDLHDPDVAAAWAAFRHDPTSPASIRALGAQLRALAHIDVRRYAVRSDFDGGAAGVALGVKLGGELDRTIDRAKLLSAASRPPGGLWERRLDCLVAV